MNQDKLERLLGKFIQQQQLSQMSCYIFETIDSTNKVIWEISSNRSKREEAPAPIPPGRFEEISPLIVVIASEQTAGRGQWGRQWQSQRGGLYLSLLLETDLHSTDAAHLTLFSGWGIAQKLRNYQIPVSLKWPNDLILQNKKLGGIKIETRIQGEIVNQAVIGVGINWNNSVPEVGISLQSWFNNQQSASITSLEELAAITISGILAGYKLYSTEGIEGILPLYLELLTNIGQKITINGGTGVILGVTDKGELRVRPQSSRTEKEIVLLPGSISLGYMPNDDMY